MNKYLPGTDGKGYEGELTKAREQSTQRHSSLKMAWSVREKGKQPTKART